MMSAPIIDFSHLTPEERIELAEQLWDSFPVAEYAITDAELSELKRRHDELDAGGDPGEPWEQVIREIGQRRV